MLSYENLRNIIEIYNNCPIFLKGESNNSDAFKTSLDYNIDLNLTDEKIDRLLR